MIFAVVRDEMRGRHEGPLSREVRFLADLAADELIVEPAATWVWMRIAELVALSVGQVAHPQQRVLR